jgi:hypothetical protein
LVRQGRWIVRLVHADRDNAVVPRHPQGTPEYDGRPVALGSLSAVLADDIGAWVWILARRRLGGIARGKAKVTIND